MIRCLAVTIGSCLALATYLPAQTAHAASMEALLERLVGQWRMTGSVRGRPATYTLDATHVLQGRFVERHTEDVNRPPDYAARVFRMCLAEQEDFKCPVHATGSWGYLRLHRADYDEGTLGEWAKRVDGQTWSEAMSSSSMMRTRMAAPARRRLPPS